MILVAPPPMQYGDWVTEEDLLTQSSLLASCYKELADRLGVTFANAGNWDVELTYDGVHFSEAGHMAFAKGLLRTLNQVV